MARLALGVNRKLHRVTQLTDGGQPDLDHAGHIHVVPDPRPLDDALAREMHEAVARIADGVHGVAAATGCIPQAAAVR